MADTKQAMPRKEEKWKSEYRKRIVAMSVFELVDEVKESSAAIGDEFYDSHVAWEADTAVEELKSRLASCLGPDRTMQELAAWKALGFDTPDAIKVVIRAASEMAKSREDKLRKAEQRIAELQAPTEAGPDRGQQDAPDYPAILERERTLVAEGVSAVKKAIRCREWLTEGRGSYEWDDDRWHGEFAAAISEILTALAPLERVAADFSNCPQKWDDVLKARAVLAKAAREGQAPKGERIKVEREPGCKCEYAIWTNATGCPVHDDPSLLRY